MLSSSVRRPTLFVSELKMPLSSKLRHWSFMEGVPDLTHWNPTNWRTDELSIESPYWWSWSQIFLSPRLRLLGSDDGDTNLMPTNIQGYTGLMIRHPMLVGRSGQVRPSGRKKNSDLRKFRSKMAQLTCSSNWGCQIDFGWRNYIK